MTKTNLKLPYLEKNKYLPLVLKVVSICFCNILLVIFFSL
jgi:hypothetical protein